MYLANKFARSKKNRIYLRQYLTNADASTIPQFLAQTDILNLRPFFKIKHGEIENQSECKLYFKGFRTASNDSDSQLKSIPNLETVLIEEATEVKEAKKAPKKSTKKAEAPVVEEAKVEEVVEATEEAPAAEEKTEESAE